MKQRFSRQFLTLGGALLFSLSTGYSLNAQGQTAAPTVTDRPWEITLVLGGILGGPGGDIEEAMRASGWDDTEPINDIDHPFSSGSELSWAVSLRRSLRPHLEVELMATSVETGTTLGFHTGHHLFLRHSVTTIAPLLSYRIGGWHIGSGPTANRVRVERTDFGGEGGKEEWKVGVLADTGITFPRRSRLFFEGRGQYRWIPGTEVGPFTSDTGFPDDIPATMPALDIDMSHASLSVGLGARF